MQDFIKELRSRDMLHNLMPGTETLLQNKPTIGYIGFDPTAPSLHIGNLATLMLLKHFQQAGHQPIVLLGGATGMIGDPSFKATERKLLDRDTLAHNQACIARQVSKFLVMEGKNAALVVNNYDWFKEIEFLSFLREVGKYITINYMLAKEAIKKRLQTGISYTEFAYPLLQAYDFYYLYKHHGAKLQMGGSDQWGNITTGTELIRKKARGEAFGLTTPLITKADGTKFGKTEQGNVWLDPNLTSPYQFYQYWLNCSDEDASNLIKKMTTLKLATIKDIIKTHQVSPHKRLLQKELAKAITILVHSHDAYLQASQASEILFGKTNETNLANLDEATLLQALVGVPQITLTHKVLTTITNVTDLVSTATESLIFSSKRAARQMIQEGGVRINKIKITNPHHPLTFVWLHNKYLLVQKGKKNYYLIKRIRSRD